MGVGLQGHGSSNYHSQVQVTGQLLADLSPPSHDSLLWLSMPPPLPL